MKLYEKLISGSCCKNCGHDYDSLIVDNLDSEHYLAYYCMECNSTFTHKFNDVNVSEDLHYAISNILQKLNWLQSENEHAFFTFDFESEKFFDMLTNSQV